MTTITANKLINMQNCVYYRMNFEISFQLDIFTRNVKYKFSIALRKRTDAPAQTQRHTMIAMKGRDSMCTCEKKRNEIA